MEWLTPLLPATVIAAIALFIIKEATEGFRRRRADARKSHAFRILLARECELNHWAVKKLKEALVAIQDNFADNSSTRYLIERRRSGEIVFVQQREERVPSSWRLPDASTDLMKQVMLDVAALDRSLFASLESAYDSTVNLRHVRESLIHYIESDDEDDKLFFNSFLEYGLAELTDVLADLDQLYQKCTGEKLKQIRVR